MKLLGILFGLSLSGVLCGHEFPSPFNSEKQTGLIPADEAAKGFLVPEGISVEVFASEPEVMNPIAMSWDARGRISRADVGG